MNETDAVKLSWGKSVLWVVAGLVAGFIGLKFGPKSLVVHRWWVDSPTGAPDDLAQGFLAIVASSFLASTLALSLGNLIFPRSGTRPLLVSFFVTAGLFLLILAIVALAVADLMKWV